MALALRWVFSTDIKTDSDFCFIHNWLSGFYNRGRKCLLRGTNWFLIKSRLRFVFKRLIKGCANKKWNRVYWKLLLTSCENQTLDKHNYLRAIKHCTAVSIESAVRRKPTVLPSWILDLTGVSAVEDTIVAWLGLSGRETKNACNILLWKSL